MSLTSYQSYPRYDDPDRIHRVAYPRIAGSSVLCSMCAHWTVFYDPAEERSSQ